MHRAFLSLLALLPLAACAAPAEADPAQLERDTLYMLAAYAIVAADWQGEDIPRFERRGYNIGALLVAPDGTIAGQALNCTTALGDATQHGEVRAMQHYLAGHDAYNLRGFTLYTTLEPCAMCAGMMVMTNLERVVYGQRDVEYAHALERLAFDSTSIGGYAPYPRAVAVAQDTSELARALDAAYADFLAHDDEKILAKFLATPAAAAVFARARETLRDYTPLFPENAATLARVRAHLAAPSPAIPATTPAAP